MTRQRDSEVKKGGKANQQEKKSYSKPQLIEYGHLEKMTQSGTGASLDFRLRRRGTES